MQRKEILVMNIDKRVLRQKNIFDNTHLSLILSAIDLINDENFPNEKINISQIAKKAGTSVATAYNHFPNNLLDVYGSILNYGLRNISSEFKDYMENESDPELRILKFIELQASEVIKYGNAIRVAFFNIDKILSSGNWLSDEPLDYVINLCEDYKNKSNSEIDPHKLAVDIVMIFNGALFLWMRYDSNFRVWSKYNDDWFIDQTKRVWSMAISSQ